MAQQHESTSERERTERGGARGAEPAPARPDEHRTIEPAGRAALVEAPRASRVEWWILGLACAAALFLQGVLFLHSGAVWRDEASTVLVASASPTLGTMWTWLSKDSSPVLVYALLRIWAAVGPGGEAWLRLLGTLVWVGLIASVALSSRSLTGRPPLLAFTLMAFNPSLFYWASSLRAYGLAVLLILPCCAAFWHVTRKPTGWNVAKAALLAILSCHASYQNSYLLFAFGLAAAVCCAVAGLWRRAVVVLGIGLLAALTLLVYSRTIREYRDASRIASFDISAATIGQRLTEAVGGDSTAILALWGTLLAAAVAWLVVRMVRRLRASRAHPSVELYFLIILAVANGAGLLFFKSHGLFPNPWHFLPFLAIAALLVEVSLASRSAVGPAARARIVLALLVIALGIAPLWRLAHIRRTNLDRTSAWLELRAAPQDLILLNPFWIAPGFKYHYRGAAEWGTLPLTSTDLESSIFPFAPIKQAMATPGALRPTLERIDATLARGNRLWIVGGIEIPKPDAVALNLAPAPTATYGWNSIVYQMDWAQQVGALLRDRGCRVEPVAIDVGQEVNLFENLPLVMIEGRQR